MLIIPFFPPAIQTPQISNIENDIQKQIDIISNKIIDSLLDCEKQFLTDFLLNSDENNINYTHSMILAWLLIRKKESPHLDMINNLITYEMIKYLTKKHDLLLVWIEEFKSRLVLAAVVEKLHVKNCTLDTAMHRVFYYTEYLIENPIRDTSLLKKLRRKIRK